VEVATGPGGPQHRLDRPAPAGDFIVPDDYVRVCTPQDDNGDQSHAWLLIAVDEVGQEEGGAETDDDPLPLDTCFE